MSSFHILAYYSALHHTLLTRYRYTSLGSTYNTFPNPALLVEDDNADGASEGASTRSLYAPSSTSGSRGTTDDTPETWSISMDEGKTGEGALHDHVNGASPASVKPASIKPASIKPTTSPSQKSASIASSVPRYRPAYELKDGSLERSGRGSSKPVQPQQKAA
jgi:FAD synthetase